MSLRSDRHEDVTDISFFMNSTATRGGIVSISATTSSGAAMDQSEATVEYKANPSGSEPIGLLLNDVVNLDLTRQHENWHKDEVQVGGKVTVLKRGWVVSDFVYPGHNPTPGQRAYVGHSGYMGSADVATDDTDLTGETRIVGRFLSGEDEDGFAKVEVNLPR